MIFKALMIPARPRSWTIVVSLLAAPLFTCALERPRQQKKYAILSKGASEEPGIVTCIGDSISRYYPHSLEWALRRQDTHWFVRNYHQPCSSASGSWDTSASCGG